MSAVDLAAVVVTIVCLAVVALLVVAMLSLIRTVRELRHTVDQLRASTLPMVDDLTSTVAKAGVELERVDGLIDRAERISTTVDNASRLTYKAFAPPLIKTMSVVAGASRATWRLRSRRSYGSIDVRGRDAPTHAAVDASPGAARRGATRTRAAVK